MRNYLLYYSETHPSRVPRSKWQITGFLQGHITCTYCTVSTENIITTRIQIGISSNWKQTLKRFCYNFLKTFASNFKSEIKPNITRRLAIFPSENFGNIFHVLLKQTEEEKRNYIRNTYLLNSQNSRNISHITTNRKFR